ncbi:lipid A export permease/ATP-binding protein MsbA [Thiocystis violascens]|uniref:Lipid A export permease/ATP-binding protein MsbA n=1 Tax=Thiocystis violascens (strain ATCC 17096 / DSM 198 / 6111) TaxID=765911 RepID=I3YF81_THIV6|nr:lipid A export permease/ATP-binding protein MsbA [Thiocystis violascens]AFL75649.1 lipid A export permease/ATP-binding protein MsbA [Thiocystis violascens DSM 198]
MSKDPVLTNADARQVYRRLLQYVKPYWRIFSLSIVGMLIFAATEPLFAAMMKPLIDGSFVERNEDMVRAMPLFLVGLFVVRGIAGFINTYCLSWVGRRVVADLRREMFGHLLRAPTRYFDNQGSGHILAKLTYNVENVASAATSAITTLVRDGFTVIGLMGFMLYINAALSAIFLVIGPVMAGAVKYATKRFRRHSRRIQNRVGDLTQVAQEAIEAHRVVKAFGGQAREARRFNLINEKTRSLQMKMIATEAASVPLVQLISAAAIGVVVYLSTMQGLKENISVGTFMSFVVAMGLLLPPVKRLTSVNAKLQQGIIAAESLFELLDSEEESDRGTRTLDRAEGRIDYRGVSHLYADDKLPAIQALDLLVMPGEKVALVGRSGSGKSTVASLLPRFYDATAGEILIDGIPIRELTLASLRAQISLVSQDVVLFNDSIANNIAYGRDEPPTLAELERVAQSAHALEFIETLPQGFDTLVGDRGVMLSGGQRQRLAIARAMLKDAPILILDEATSALDTEAERHIQAALQELMARRTTLVIAHRLSTIENADRILVLQDGRIVEQGRHSELLELGGYYARLHRLQFHDAA